MYDELGMPYPPGIAPPPMPQLPPPAELPLAASVPPGTMLLSLSGTGRTTFRAGVAMWCAALVGAGFALGWWWGRRRR